MSDLKKKRYISQKDLKNLENSISFLSNYEDNEKYYNFIGENINSENVELTKLLKELSKVNKKRKKLIHLLCYQ